MGSRGEQGNWPPPQHHPTNNLASSRGRVFWKLAVCYWKVSCVYSTLTEINASKGFKFKVILFVAWLDGIVMRGRTRISRSCEVFDAWYKSLSTELARQRVNIHVQPVYSSGHNEPCQHYLEGSSVDMENRILRLHWNPESWASTRRS